MDVAKSDDQVPVRVVDRRWWARAADAEEAPPEEGVRKPSYVEDLERRVADQATQLQAALADRRRAADEFEQIRTRMRRDVARDVDRAKRAVLAELLEVLDNLDRAIASAREASTPSADPLLKGVELVRDQFVTKLASFGAVRIAALGQPFDAAQHEAVSMAPVTDPSQDGVIVAVLKEGYAMGDELLRPASVVVGKI